MQLGLTPWSFKDMSAAALSEQAAFAESLGYDSFWLPENHFNPQAIPDPLMLLAGVAAATSTIKLAATLFSAAKCFSLLKSRRRPLPPLA